MIVQILNSKIKMNSDEIVMERKTANFYGKKFPLVNRYYAFSIKLLFSERLKLTACKFSEVTISKQLSRAVMWIDRRFIYESCSERWDLLNAFDGFSREVALVTN